MWLFVNNHVHLVYLYVLFRLGFCGESALHVPLYGDRISTKWDNSKLRFFIDWRPFQRFDLWRPTLYITERLSSRRAHSMGLYGVVDIQQHQRKKYCRRRRHFGLRPGCLSDFPGNFVSRPQAPVSKGYCQWSIREIWIKMRNDAAQRQVV